MVRSSVLSTLDALGVAPREAPPCVLGVACSGGVDSTVLVHCLADIYAGSPVTLHVIHIHHGLRGADSDADAAFVRALAEHRQLPYTERRVDVARGAQSSGVSLEDAGRRARFACFDDLFADGTVDYVALAHTATDQAETVLMRFLRGSSVRGLGGMAPRRDKFLRPLLYCTREDVLAYAAAHHLDWRDDVTNTDRRHLRNRIRHDLMPLLEQEYAPRLSERLAALSDVYRATDTFLTDHTQRLQNKAQYADPWGHVCVWRPALGNQPDILRFSLWRTILETDAGCERIPTMTHVRALDEFTQSAGGGRLTLPHGWTIERSGEWVRLIRDTWTPPPPWDTRPATDGAHAFPAGTVTITIRDLPASGAASTRTSSCNEAYINDACTGELALRPVHPDDRLAPAGRPGRKRIRDILSDAKVPRWERPYWPVLTWRGEPVWTPGAPPAAPVLPPAGATRALTLTWTTPHRPAA